MAVRRCDLPVARAGPLLDGVRIRLVALRRVRELLFAGEQAERS